MLGISESLSLSSITSLTRKIYDTQDENPIETNWKPIEISIGFNWSQWVLIGFNRSKLDSSWRSSWNHLGPIGLQLVFNWSELSQLDQWEKLSNRAIGPIGFKWEFNWFQLGWTLPIGPIGKLTNRGIGPIGL